MGNRHMACANCDGVSVQVYWKTDYLNRVVYLSRKAAESFGI